MALTSAGETVVRGYLKDVVKLTRNHKLRGPLLIAAGGILILGIYAAAVYPRDVEVNLQDAPRRVVPAKQVSPLPTQASGLLSE